MDTPFRGKEKIIADSANEFSTLLNQLGEHIGDQFQTVATGTVLRTWKEIIARTPVDTGRARANWQIGTEVTGTVVDGEFKSSDRTRSAPPRRLASDPNMPQGRARTELKNADVKWIFNNLPYIEALEAGHSGQAPAGMVAESLQMMNNYLKSELEKLK